MGVVWGVPVTSGRGVFAGLADSRGFIERECEVAAATGRLADIVRCPRFEQRQHPVSGSGRVSAVEALARLHELRGRLLDVQLKAARLRQVRAAGVTAHSGRRTPPPPARSLPGGGALRG
jgi:hypothetical protein